MTAHSDHIDPAPAEFTTFYRDTVERTFRIAYLMAREDRQVAREATQLAYERLLYRWESLAVKDKARHVTGLAVRTVADTCPEGQPGGRSEAESPRELIARQPATCRAVALLLFLEDYSAQEIAGVLDVAETEIIGHTDQIRLILKRPLVRRAYAEGRPPPFDVEAGLHDVLVQATAQPDWRELTGRERHTACLVAARHGDRAAFSTLVSELTPLVWHVARGNGLARAEAEDVTQTVWLALLRNVDRLADPRALAAWLITTTRREANRLRRQADRLRDVGEEGIDRMPALDPTPEDEVLRDDRDRTLWTVFRRLSPRCQEMLRLTVLAGRAEYRVVAEAMHMPVGGIGPTRGRCLKTLREYYEREVGR